MSKSQDPFVEQTEQFILDQRLLADGASVVVAVSGGADSVALAGVLHAIGRYHLNLAHVHHGLRPQADADAAFVDQLARRWLAPFYLEKIDTPGLAKEWGVGTEEAARRGRYAALVATAQRTKSPAVAVAHHSDDQVETVLHRIVRGTHLRGLGGMPVSRPLGEGVALVRPLLWARRSEVEQFCRRQELAWQTDHTNAITDYSRNFIRHDLLPLVRQRLNVRADEAILRLAAAADEAQQVLEELAEELFKRACRKRSPSAVALRVAPLKKAQPLLAAMALRRALAELDAPEQELNQERFADLLAVLLGQTPAANLPGNIHVKLDNAALLLTRTAHKAGKK
jgi:tRNA(Ile)-lysidine synthase